MIPFATSLDDLDFDALVEVGRNRLPALAPGWTDYNYHDPGITLIELLAWVADTQIYALGRDRLDERLAMAALIGLRPCGALPATGVLYPPDAPAETTDYDVPAGARLTPASGSAPRLEVTDAVTVLPLSLIRLTGEHKRGGATDLTDANRRARTSFAPFGTPPEAGAALVVRLAGTLPRRDVRLSLGIESEDGGGPAPEEDQLGAVSLFYRTGDGEEVPLRCPLDSSVDLQRSGVIIVELPAGGPQTGRGEHEIVLRADTRHALMPRLLRIAPNALPVAQKASFELRDHRGTGRASQRIVIEPRMLFGSDEDVEGRVWRLTEDADGESGPRLRVGQGASGMWRAGDLERAGPADRFYAISEASDGSRIEIGFGNGVNGRRPEPHHPIEIGFELSCGAAGNVVGSTDWLLAAPRTRWRNRQPLAGGRDAQGVGDLLDEARRRLRAGRPLTGSRQIEEAALGLPEAFGVARAAIVEGWEPGRRRPASATTRTLIVTRRGQGGESAGWLRAVGRSLRPLLPLAERLVVAAPAYRDFRIAARIVAAPGARPDQVVRAVRDELADRLTPGGTKGRTWPLGRDLSAIAVAGWIRRVAGVAAVPSVTLLDGRGRPAGATLELRRDQLPRLIDGPGDIVVEAGSRR